MNVNAQHTRSQGAFSKNLAYLVILVLWEAASQTKILLLAKYFTPKISHVLTPEI